MSRAQLVALEIANNPSGTAARNASAITEATWDGEIRQVGHDLYVDLRGAALRDDELVEGEVVEEEEVELEEAMEEEELEEKKLVDDEALEE